MDFLAVYEQEESLPKPLWFVIWTFTHLDPRVLQLLHQHDWQFCMERFYATRVLMEPSQQPQVYWRVDSVAYISEAKAFVEMLFFHDNAPAQFSTIFASQLCLHASLLAMFQLVLPMLRQHLLHKAEKLPILWDRRAHVLQFNGGRNRLTNTRRVTV